MANLSLYWSQKLAYAWSSHNTVCIFSYSLFAAISQRHYYNNKLLSTRRLWLHSCSVCSTPNTRSLSHTLGRCLRNSIVFLPLPQSANGETFALCAYRMCAVCRGKNVFVSLLFYISFHRCLFSFFRLFACSLVRYIRSFALFLLLRFVVFAIVLIWNLLLKRRKFWNCMPCLVLQRPFNAYISSYII